LIIISSSQYRTQAEKVKTTKQYGKRNMVDSNCAWKSFFPLMLLFLISLCDSFAPKQEKIIETKDCKKLTSEKIAKINKTFFFIFFPLCWKKPPLN
jgi:hypothetical protein